MPRECSSGPMVFHENSAKISSIIPVISGTACCCGKSGRTGPARWRRGLLLRSRPGNKLTNSANQAPIYCNREMSQHFLPAPIFPRYLRSRCAQTSMLPPNRSCVIGDNIDDSTSPLRINYCRNGNKYHPWNTNNTEFIDYLNSSIYRIKYKLVFITVTVCYGLKHVNMFASMKYLAVEVYKVTPISARC